MTLHNLPTVTARIRRYSRPRPPPPQRRPHNMWVKCSVLAVSGFAVAMSGIAVRLVPRLLRHGDMGAICNAASLCGGIALNFAVLVMNALDDRPFSPAFLWVDGLKHACFGGAIAVAGMGVPHVITKALLTRSIRRRFDALREGDRLWVGEHADEAVLASRLEGSGGARCVFLVMYPFMGWVMDVTRDEFVILAAHTSGLWRLLYSPRHLRRSRCDMVAMVREMALDEKNTRWQLPGVGDKLVAAAWRLERPARVIQRALRRALSDPSYLMCRRRLQREWSDLPITGSSCAQAAPRGTEIIKIGCHVP